MKEKILGEIIRQKIRENGRTAKVICEEMGMSRGNLDKIYHKESLNTDLLAQFCLVLDYDFFQHVNPFRRVNEDASSHTSRFSIVAEDPADYGLASGQVREALSQLDSARQELNFLRTSLGDIKNNLRDKDEIIALQKDKIALQQDKIAFLETRIAALQGD